AHDGQPAWSTAGERMHAGVQALVGHLNRTYVNEPALHIRDVDARGFEWLDANNAESSVLVFARRSQDEDHPIIVACNFTPVPQHNYRVGVSDPGVYREIVNTDAKEYGGSGQGNLGGLEATPAPHYGRPYSLNVTLPPLGAVFLKRL
ncbi:MAG: alpha amylase C-terminal domain-containing protein, partial [Vicinamibacterales bacterium]